MHNNIAEEVHDLQENVQEKIIQVSFNAHEEEVMQNNIGGQVHPASLIFHEG